MSLKSNSIQHFGSVRKSLHIGLSEEVRLASATNLNQVLADTLTLRDLYKKHHWQVSGPHFQQLHLLFDKHFGEQSELVDTLAERVQLLGGVAVAMAADVAELTRIPRAPGDREDWRTQIGRLLEAHEVILKESHQFAAAAAQSGDDATNDMLVGDVIATGELQAWFLNEHVVE